MQVVRPKERSVVEALALSQALLSHAQTQGTVVPDSFTHGTSAQRMEALQRGYNSGNMDACTF